ncbi:AT-rich interactive domain protein [Quillaja saponaria]|uniref:AT-rich interactive domain protein n=1 Tax=Quillaja saponaria TaxID=32244 RepID=A0AAD7PPT1_QUISA|nr:AT-rich interactive domain protein [Quillaja saponaria]KAJ7962415.1 AT-rich interactive domain protein [Quillaja saponaria]
MAGWSMVADKSALGCTKTPHKLEQDGFSVDLWEARGGEVEGKPDKPSWDSIVKSEQDKLRYWFHQFLSVFLKEICAHDSFRPNPPSLGDGQCVDLYKLFMVVREKGGYDVVSKNILWDSVAEESGLGTNVGPAVKLVYVKYLDNLDKLSKRVASKGSDCGLSNSGNDLGECLMELKAEVKGLLNQERSEEVYRLLDLVCELGFSDVGKLYKTDKVKNVVVRSCGAMKVKDESILDLDMIESKLNVTSVEQLDECKICVDGKENIHLNPRNIAVNVQHVINLSEDDDEVNSTPGVLNGDNKYKSVDSVMVIDPASITKMPGVRNGDKKCESDDDVMIMDPASITKDSFGRKRKRESMWEMLNWVTGTAKNPCAPDICPVPERSKWKSNGNEEIWKQVLFVREAIFLRRQFESSAEQSIWQSQKMHPCMYDDQVGAAYNFRERLKCDKRPLSMQSTPQVQVYSETSSGTGYRSDKRSLSSSTSLPGVDKYSSSKRVSLGSTFQADVPEWTGVASESDPKWLGTQIWPSEKVHKFLIERDPIGKGRQDSCGCPEPGSNGCIRFHIAEKRSKVKLELGVAFYQWNFDKMGEEVKLSWTEEEENLFRDVVRLNPPSQEKYFWDDMFRSFPTKSRVNLKIIRFWKRKKLGLT